MQFDGEARLERNVQRHVKHASRTIERNLVRADRLPVQLHRLRRALRVRKAHTRDVHARWIPKGALDSELAALVRKADSGRVLLRDRHAIVEVQRAGCGALGGGRDNELEVRLPQLRRGHRAVRTEGQHGSSLDTDGDRGEVDVGERRGAAALRRRERVEVVEELVRVVDVHGRRVLLDDRRDQDGGAEEELSVDREGVRVLGELVPERVEHGCAVKLSLVERRVQVVNEAVPHVKCVLGCLDGRRPAVKLLADGGVRVVLEE